MKYDTYDIFWVVGICVSSTKLYFMKPDLASCNHIQCFWWKIDMFHDSDDARMKPATVAEGIQFISHNTEFFI